MKSGKRSGGYDMQKNIMKKGKRVWQNAKIIYWMKGDGMGPGNLAGGAASHRQGRKKVPALNLTGANCFGWRKRRAKTGSPLPDETLETLKGAGSRSHERPAGHATVGTGIRSLNVAPCARGWISICLHQASQPYPGLENTGKSIPSL